MASELCRVRTVRLRAPRDDLVRRAAILLEDALRTASRPVGLGRRLLVVRSLALGAIHASRGAANVALTVEGKLRELEPRAVHALDASAPARDVVYFRDDLEAYVALAVRVAVQRPTDAWFWQLAVPVWRPGTPRDDALRALLLAVVDTPAAAAAGAALVGAVEEQGALDPLLGALRPRDGPVLLRAFGWDGASPVTSDVPSRRLPNVSDAQVRTLERWVPRWGGDDARSLWLASSLLVAERPVRAFDSAVPVVARALVVRIVEGRLRMRVRDTEGAHLTGGPRIAGAPEAVPSPETATPPDARDVRRERDEPTARSTEPTTPSVAGDSPPVGSVSTSTPAAGAPQDRTSGRAMGARESDLDGISLAGSPRVPASGAAGETARARHSSPTAVAPLARAANGGESPRAGANRAASSPDERAAKPRDGKPRRPRRTGSGDTEDERATAHAGLFLLLPLVSRLGMPAFLTGHGELIERDFPTMLLRYVAQRLAIPADDPTLVALAQPDDEAHRWDGDFVAPDSWSRSVAARDTAWLVRRAESVDGGDRRALTDGSWRLVLALWRGRAPAAVRALRAGVPVTRGRPLAGSPAMDILLGSWLAAMRRWCHRHAGIGLRRLVVRPGRIASTRTHVDVLFELRQIDIDVRRAGLDIDPGWLPWFGRVVAYHYGTRGRGNAR